MGLPRPATPRRVKLWAPFDPVGLLLVFHEGSDIRLT